MENENRGVAGLIIGFVALVIIVILGLMFAPFTIVQAGDIGVVTKFGKVQDETLESGFHFVSPIASVHKINTQTQVIKFDEEDKTPLGAASKDLQDVSISVTASYHLQPNNVKTIYSQYKGADNFESGQMEPLVRQVVKSASAQYTAEELVTKRAEFSDKVYNTLKDEFEKREVVFENFQVTNLKFSDQFTQAIELKATAVQNAEASKNKLVQVQYEAQQQIESAKAQAETIRIQAQAITQQGGKDYVQLQAIAKWNGQLPSQMVPGSTVPFLDLNGR